MTIKLIRSLLVIAYDIKLCLDAILLMCGHYMRNGVHESLMKDTIDDLLEIRTVLSQDEDTLKGVLEDIDEESA